MAGGSSSETRSGSKRGRSPARSPAPPGSRGGSRGGQTAGMSDKEKRHLYRPHTQAQDLLQETSKALQDSVEVLIEHESEWLREKEEFRKYGLISVYPDTREKQQFLRQVRRQVDQTEAKGVKDSSFNVPENSEGDGMALPPPGKAGGRGSEHEERYSPVKERTELLRLEKEFFPENNALAAAAQRGNGNLSAPPESGDFSVGVHNNKGKRLDASKRTTGGRTTATPSSEDNNYCSSAAGAGGASSADYSQPLDDEVADVGTNMNAGEQVDDEPSKVLFGVELLDRSLLVSSMEELEEGDPSTGENDVDGDGADLLRPRGMKVDPAADVDDDEHQTVKTSIGAEEQLLDRPSMSGAEGSSRTTTRRDTASKEIEILTENKKQDDDLVDVHVRRVMSNEQEFFSTSKNDERREDEKTSFAEEDVRSRSLQEDSKTDEVEAGDRARLAGREPTTSKSIGSTDHESSAGKYTTGVVDGEETAPLPDILTSRPKPSNVVKLAPLSQVRGPSAHNSPNEIKERVGEGLELHSSTEDHEDETTNATTRPGTSHTSGSQGTRPTTTSTGTRPTTTVSGKRQHQTTPVSTLDENVYHDHSVVLAGEVKQALYRAAHPSAPIKSTRRSHTLALKLPEIPEDRRSIPPVPVHNTSADHQLDHEGLSHRRSSSTLVITKAAKHSATTKKKRSASSGTSAKAGQPRTKPVPIETVFAEIDQLFKRKPKQNSKKKAAASTFQEDTSKSPLEQSDKARESSSVKKQQGGENDISTRGLSAFRTNATTNIDNSNTTTRTKNHVVDRGQVEAREKSVVAVDEAPSRFPSLKELRTPHVCNAKLLLRQLEREEREEIARIAEWQAILEKHDKDTVAHRDLPSSPSSKSREGSPSALERKMSTSIVPVPGEKANEHPPIPDWLSTKSLVKRRYLPASTGNLHGLQAGEFHSTKWPLPKMFGEEKYAYSLIDIEDPRYVDECANMGKQLIHYFYDQQIFDLKWRETYKQLIRAEKRRANLPALASNKAKDELDGNVKKFKKYLLELQEQRDLYQGKIDGIFERCAQIKRSIKKENDLEELRMEMTGRVKAKFSQEDGFWNTQFNCTRPDEARGSDEDLLLSD